MYLIINLIGKISNIIPTLLNMFVFGINWKNCKKIFTCYMLILLYTRIHNISNLFYTQLSSKIRVILFLHSFY